MTDTDLLDSYAAALRHRDRAGLAALLAEDAVLTSPILASVSFVGRDEVLDVLGVVTAHVDSAETRTSTAADGTRVVRVFGTFDGTPMEAIELVETGEHGLISTITVFVRPLRATVAMLVGVAPEMARRSGHPVLARLAAVSLRPLVPAARAMDRAAARIVPSARPGRSAAK